MPVVVDQDQLHIACSRWRERELDQVLASGGNACQHRREITVFETCRRDEDFEILHAFVAIVVLDPYPVDNREIISYQPHLDPFVGDIPVLW